MPRLLAGPDVKHLMATSQLSKNPSPKPPSQAARHAQ